MVRHNLRVFAFVILSLAFAVYAAIFFLTQDLESLDFGKALTHVSTTISINILVWIVFVQWAWKWRVFYPWLVQVPNLEGKWSGTLKPNWKDGEIPPIPIEITITQSFFTVQVGIQTGESRSFSIGASFDIENERGQRQLFYSYLNTPNSSVRKRSAIHYGSAMLHFDGFDVCELTGEYWTSRETTGEIQVSRS